jgi:cell wall-associated NlpC family hydrolase
MAAPVVAAAAAVAKHKLKQRLLRLLLVIAPVLVVGILCIVVLMVMLFTGGKAKNAVDLTGNGCISVVTASQTSVARLDKEQLMNAQTIVAVGRQAEVPAYGWVVAVATAMQESGLRNLDHGDRDSIGLFQQRAAWGSDSQRMDAAASARMFYTGGHQSQPGLTQIRGWESMSVAVAAQSVQRSAFPDAYAKWQALAVRVVGDPSVLSAVCTGGDGFVGDGSQGSNVFAAALRYLGTPYSWGGGGPNGPSAGFGMGAETIGFDCSSLAQYAWKQGAGLALPRVTNAQATATTHLPRGATLRAGDLLFFQNPGDPTGSYHHMGIYDGNGNMVHAPRTGKTVEVVHDVFRQPYYAAQFALATRPGPASALAIGANDER